MHFTLCFSAVVVVDAVFAVIGSILGLIFCFFGLYLFKFSKYSKQRK